MGLRRSAVRARALTLGCAGRHVNACRPRVCLRAQASAVAAVKGPGVHCAESTCARCAVSQVGPGCMGEVWPGIARGACQRALLGGLSFVLRL